MGPLTAASMAERARAQAAALDALGVAHGERVAIVSQNSARLLTAFWGVSGVRTHPRADQLPPRRRRDPATSSTTPVPRCCSWIRSSTTTWANLDVTHRHVLGAESDEELYRYGVEPRPWDADEDATATVNYTSGTTARPKGVQLTHRNLWVNSVTFALHMGVNDRDVYLHTLPMFHCNGWGMTYGVTAHGCPARGAAQGRRHGDPAPGRPPRRHAHVRGTCSGQRGARRGRVVGRSDPRTRHRAHRGGGCTAAHAHDRAGRDASSAGSSTRSTASPRRRRSSRSTDRRAEYDDLTPTERARKLGRAGGPALGRACASTSRTRCSPTSNVVMDGYWAQPDADRGRDRRRLVPHR